MIILSPHDSFVRQVSNSRQEDEHILFPEYPSAVVQETEFPSQISGIPSPFGFWIILSPQIVNLQRGVQSVDPSEPSSHSSNPI